VDFGRGDSVTVDGNFQSMNQRPKGRIKGLVRCRSKSRSRLCKRNTWSAFGSKNSK